MDKPTRTQIRIWGEDIIASDRQAFDRLFRSLYPRLIRFARTYIRNRAVARDIVQDTFVTLWEKRQSIDPKQSIQAYLYKIVRNKSLNYIRDHADETLGLDYDFSAEIDNGHKDIDPNEDDERIRLLREWIEALPRRQREAFKLSRFEGLDHDEIAGVMEISPNTVNNHIVAALNFLRSRYDKHNEKQVSNR